MKSSVPVLTINLKTICENYEYIAKLCAPSKVSAVVKADAYGLGAIRIAKSLAEVGCRDFFVATCTEGLSLVKAFVKLKERSNIYVLHGPFISDVKQFTKYGLIPVINHLEQLKIWQNYAVKLKKKLPAILHVNTGIHRYGMPLYELDLLAKNRELFNNIEFKYIMSHLACADDSKSSYNLRQLNDFKKVISYFPGARGCFANSDGVFLGKDYCFDMVRIGASLYGINNNTANPVKLFAPIIQIQELEKGSLIGYGNSYSTKNSSLIATVAVGYADGFLRHFGENFNLYIESYAVPIVGRISMDFLSLDVTNVPREKIFLGTQVEVIGEHISPSLLAHNSKTIAYEILTLLGKRYKKVYVSR